MPSEVPHSPALVISHLLAARETAALNYERIIPDLSVVGITRLERSPSLQVMRQIDLPPHLTPVFTAEAEQILQLLKEMGIEPRGLRDALYKRLGDGGYRRSKDERISRSDDVRAAFNRASDIAAEKSAQMVMVHHLLAAILEIPGTHIRAELSEMGVDVDALREKAAVLPMPAMIERPRNGLINQFGTDLTEKAHRGDLPPVIGRSDEMMRIVKILGRDKKNCPVLVGAAGVGKTAIVEGLAQRIAVKNIHPDLHNKRIVQLNASALVAGTKYRGDFEERMTQLIAEISVDPNLILFIDEIHLLIGAGAGGSSGMDAANILKPALANGSIRLIGATTDTEYRQYIEKDAALERRFEPVRVAEPSAQETVKMLTGARERLQEKHGVTILDEAIPAAVELSVRYITDRFLPDKAYTLLDDACAEARYGSILSYRPDQMDAQQVINAVTADTVRAVLAERLDIPINQIGQDEYERVMRMADELRQRVIGQDAAIDAVVQIVQRHYAGMSASGRPVGVFLFTGPTGVGKTELAKATAAFLFHDEKRLIRLDMGEYMEKHNVARLIGAPPGYSGYEQGGQLTNSLRDKRAAIVLIDEIEKAHSDVLNVFLSLFDNGRMTDGQGRTVDGQNALFIMTSNLGYTSADANPTPDEVKRAVYSHLRPEFINRIDSLVYFQPLQSAHMEDLVRIQCDRLKQQLKRHFIELEVTDEAVQWLTTHGYDPQMGARALVRLFEAQVITPISRMLLMRELAAGEVALVRVQNDKLIVECKVLITHRSDKP
jgi:ATP-dependent Clp protease ATP-binding subunit ClpC